MGPSGRIIEYSRAGAKPARDRVSASCLFSRRANQQRVLVAAAVVVGLAGAFESDLVLRDSPAFLHRRSLGVRFRLRLWVVRMRDLVHRGRVNAANWCDHL